MLKVNKKTNKKIYKICATAIFICIAYILNRYGLQTNPNEEYEVNSLKSVDNIYTVTRVVDGDTLVIEKNGVSSKVRLIGVDTPESVHPDKEKNTEFGKTASNYTKERVLNKEVKLEFDVQELDKYGRTLAYVYIDDVMLNEELVRSGMAKVSTYPPNVKYVEKFEQAQKEARINKLGLWAEEYNI